MSLSSSASTNNGLLGENDSQTGVFSDDDDDDKTHGFDLFCRFNSDIFVVPVSGFPLEGGIALCSESPSSPC